MEVKISYQPDDKEFLANCGKCGALLYIAENISTFNEVFPVERPYCYHCGEKVSVNSNNKPKKSKKVINIVRYVDACGNTKTNIISDKSLKRYVDNWNWQYNGDGSGLEVLIIKFESILQGLE